MAAKIKIDIVGDASDATRALREAARETRNLTSRLNVFAVVASVAGARAARWARAITLAIGPAFQLAGALKPVIGILVAFPAAATSAIGVFSALKIALSGAGGAISAAFAITPLEMKQAEVAHRRSILAVSVAQNAYNKALKNVKATELDRSNALERLTLAQASVTDTQTAYTKALDGLPSATRKFVQSVVAQRKALDGLRGQVSAALFTPFTSQIKGLIDHWVPILRQGLGQIAFATGTVASKLIDVVNNSKPFNDGIKAIFRSTRAGIASSGSALTALVDSIGHVLTVGAPFIRLVGNLIGKVSGQFAGWLTRMAKTGQLKKWLDGSVVALGQLWVIGRNLIGIFGSLLRVGGEGSETLLETIERLTGQFDAFLRTAEGGAEMRRFFQFLRTITYTIFRTIIALEPIISSVFGAFGKHVLPVLETMSKWLLKNKEQAKLIGEVLLAAFAVRRIALMVAGLAKVATAIRAIITLEKIAAVWSAIVNPASLLIGAAALGVYLGYLERKNQWVERAWKAWSDAVVKEWNGALLALSTAWGAFWTSVVREWTGAGLALSRGKQSFAQAVVKEWAGALLTLSGAWNAVSGFFRTRYEAMLAFYRAIPVRIRRFFQNVRSDMQKIGQQIMDGLTAGARSRWDSIKKFFTDLTDKIKDWKGPISRDKVLLFGAGQKVMDGFIGGLRSRAPNLKTALAGVTNSIGSAIGAGTSPGIKIEPARAPDSHVHIHLAPGVKTIDAERELHQMLSSFQRRTGIRLLVS